MLEAGRIGDRAQCSADAHGCSGCAHSVIGPAQTGSPDVHVNGRPALRVNDAGVHSSCCGPNTWNAASGSASVIVNGQSFHRRTDTTTHCGGSGALIEGSPNVLIGDQGEFDSYNDTYDVGFILVHEETRGPMKNHHYRMITSSGEIVEDYTDENGYTRIASSQIKEIVSIEIYEDEDEYA